MIRPHEITDFWFGLTPEQHFIVDPNLDREITKRFETAHGHALAGALDDWLDASGTALALIILLDQFARNIYRGTAAMFAADNKALELAKKAIEFGHDLDVPADQRIWFYLPLQHSERLADQDLSVRLTKERIENPDTLEYAQVHRDIIEKFGRFPHRNKILGRLTTPQEQAFLDAGGFAG